MAKIFSSKSFIGITAIALAVIIVFIINGYFTADNIITL